MEVSGGTDMINHVITSIMTEAMSHIKDIVECKMNEVLGVPRNRTQTTSNSDRSNAVANRAPSAITWANRVQGAPTTDVINAEEFPPLRNPGGTNRNRNQEPRREVRQRALPKPILRWERRDQQEG